MKSKPRNLITFFLAGTLILLASSAMTSRVLAQNADPGTASGETGWPQVVHSDDGEITLYQPQIQKWEDNKLQARMAVSVTSKQSPQPVYGVVFFVARTEVDRSSGTVYLNDITIERAKFPTAEGEAGDYLPLIRRSIPGWPQTIALELLQADLAIARAEMKTQARTQVKNDPPRIFFSTRPAVLVLVDGAPTLRQMTGTPFMRIINTRALLVLDRKSGTYYLHAAGRWEEAHALEGPWNESDNAPEALAQVLEDARQSQAVDLMEDSRTGEPPAVYVSTVPADLLIAYGKPNLQPIEDTRLLFCSNSDSDIFLDLDDQHYYVLLSGRWFRGDSLENGPWKFVPGGSLPPDFSKIPENHPKGSVLASLPGTPQAREAVIANSIPQTAAVKRAEAQAEVAYDGNPSFKPVEGTPLFYAVNSSVPVIEVDRQSFFCVINGVWFSATSPGGPWAVSDNVPAIIYTIPSSCPIHYVVYVRVYGSTPEIVYVGYTPGYYGALIGVDGTVIYGTGYCYTPWIGTVWYGCPVTWGCGLAYGWYFWGWGWGWVYPVGWWPIFRPWWGPWGGWPPAWWQRGGPIHYAATGLHVNAYRHWGGKVVLSPGRRMADRHAAVNRPAGRNNHFAGSDGRVYRRGPHGEWQRNMGGDRWETLRRGNGVEGERSLGSMETSRGLGEHRINTRRIPGLRGGGGPIFQKGPNQEQAPRPVPGGNRSRRGK